MIATDCYHEGLLLTPVKLVERGRVRRDLMEMMARVVRDPRPIEIDTKAKIAANERRKQVVARYAERRADLKDTIRTAATPEERDAAVRALSRLPRDASPVRVRNRDQVDGRPRGYVGKVGLSRINLRTMAHRGELPGITKSSW